ncbi:MAG: DUF2339 domain-containing protein [Phycisphaerales bacterium]|nr:DUF2339 domain-containing protein [Phycisphaerales bacterium]
MRDQPVRQYTAVSPTWRSNRKAIEQPILVSLFMRCPRCGEWSTQSQTRCDHCKLDLTAFNRLQSLRGSLAQAGKEFESIAGRLQGLQDALANIEADFVLHLISSTEVGAAVNLPPKQTDQAPPSMAAPLTPTSAAEPIGRSERPAPASAGPTFAPFAKAQEYVKVDHLDEIKLGQKWLLIVGIVVMVLGVGYFLKYAFDQNWIGPTGRVGMAYTGGLACLGLGEMFRRRGLAVFGLYLIGGGIAVLYFSGYAAFQVYHLIDQPVAFALMVAVTALSGALSIVRNVMWLAVLGIIGGFLTPVVLSTRVDNQIALMTYMVVLNAGILAIAVNKRWGLLNGLGFAATWLLFLSWYAAHYESTKFVPTAAFLNVFFLAYAIVPFAYYFVHRDSAPDPGFVLTVLNAMIAFGLSFVMIREFASTRAVGIVSVAYAAVYGVMAAYLRRRNPRSTDAFVLLAAMTALFLIVTVPLLFARHWITVFWAVQAAVLVWAAVRLADERLLHAGAGLLFVAVFKFLCWDLVSLFDLTLPDLYFRRGYEVLAAERWIAAGMVLAATFAAGTALSRQSNQPRRLPSASFSGRLLYSVFGCFLFVILNVEASAWFHEFARPARFAAISVLWALFAIVLMLLGFGKGIAALRRCSLALFAVTLAKVFLSDMSDVSTPYRIVSFLVLGLMLIGASYLYHRFRSRIDEFEGAGHRE